MKAELLAGLVPTGKNVAWIVGLVGTSVAAGFGLALGIGERADNIDAIPEMRVELEDHGDAIDGLTVRLDDADEDRELILCLSNLVVDVLVDGEELTARERAARCP